MLVPFESLPDEARVWIYQADRSFTDEELLEVESKIQSFWKVGLPMVKG